MSPTKATIAAFLCCMAGAVLEGVLSGKGVRRRFAELNLPRHSPPFWLWILIGVGYYTTCFLVLRGRLSEGSEVLLNGVAIGLILALLAANAVWNFLFFRKQSLRACLWAFVPYGLLVAALILVLAQLDLVECSMLVGYAVYLVYATWWTWRLLRANPYNEMT